MSDKNDSTNTITASQLAPEMRTLLVTTRRALLMIVAGIDTILGTKTDKVRS